MDSKCQYMANIHSSCPDIEPISAGLKQCKGKHNPVFDLQPDAGKPEMKRNVSFRVAERIESSYFDDATPGGTTSNQYLPSRTLQGECLSEQQVGLLNERENGKGQALPVKPISELRNVRPNKLNLSSKLKRDNVSESIIDHVDLSKVSPCTVTFEETTLKRNLSKSGRIRKHRGRVSRYIRGKDSRYETPKAILGFFGGIVIGGAICILILLGQGYYTTSATDANGRSESRIDLPPWYLYLISGTFTLLLAIGLAVSNHVRCITSLVLPSLSTTRGRAVMLSIIVHILVVGPLMNTIDNARQIPEATTCQIELVANETRMVQNYLVEKLGNLGQAFEESVFNLVTSQVDRMKTLIESQKRLHELFEELARLKGIPISIVGSVAITIRNITLTDKDFLNYPNNINLTRFYDQPRVESGTSFEMIRAGVEQEFTDRTAFLRQLLVVVKSILPFSVLLLFVQAYFYYRGYMRKLEYDNIYVTESFKKIDKHRGEVGKKCLLPLRTRESAHLVDSTSLRLAKREFKELIFALVSLFVFVVFGAFLILMDYGLFVTLDIVQRHLNTTLSVSGGTGFSLVLPEGQVAPNISLLLQQEFPRVFDTNVTMLNYSSLAQTGECLPHPSTPFIFQKTMLATLISLYVAMLVLSILMSYGMRLQHVIAGYFFPLREKERVSYLYYTLMTQRVTFAQLLLKKFKLAFGRKKGERNLGPGFREWLSVKFPCLGKLFKRIGFVETPTCINCADKNNLQEVGDEWCCESCLEDSDKVSQEKLLNSANNETSDSEAEL